LRFALQKWGLAHFQIFSPKGRKLEAADAGYYAAGAAEPPR
jgi:hypothetical protein